MKNRNFIIITLILLSYGIGFCVSDSIGTGGAAFMKIPSGSAKLQGLGNNGVSYLEGTDAMSVNPSGIATSQMREFNFSYIGWFADYSGKYVSYVEPIGQSVVGFNLGYFTTSGFDARDSAGIPLNSSDIKVKSGFASLSFAKTFFLERLAIGGGLKEVFEDNYLSKQNSLVFDIGAMLKVSRKISLGFSTLNMGQKEKVVSLQRYGLTYKFNPFFLTTIEQKKFSDDNAKIGFGFEFSIPEEVLQVGKITIRTGYTYMGDYGTNYDDSTLKKLGLTNLSNWSFGVGIYSSQAFGNVYSFDYALTPFGELGKTSQLTFKFQF